MKPVFKAPPDNVSEAFYAGKRSAELPFVLNDVVAVKEGEKKGQLGWIVSLLEVAPEPRYTVELCSGQGDLWLRVSEVQLQAK